MVKLLRRIWKNVKDGGADRWHFKVVFPNFAARPQKEPSVGISGLGVDIRTSDLQNMKHNRQSL